MKEYVSEVEEGRANFEEPIKTRGRYIRAGSIWRDSELIPEEAPEIGIIVRQDNKRGGTYGYKEVYSIKDGSVSRLILGYYDTLELERVGGTIGVYKEDKLRDIVTEDFSPSYIPKIFINGKILAYGKGRPIIDVSAGVLKFEDEDFANGIGDNVVTISFYKYIGVKGTTITGRYENAELPFRDSIPHFKNAEIDGIRASFVPKGEEKTTRYILPSEKDGWYDKGVEEDTGVVLLQENLEDTLWKQNVRISGGVWTKTIEDKVQVHRTSESKLNNVEIERSEDKESNLRGDTK